MPHPKRVAKPTTIDEYLAPLPEEQREALEKLRAVIRAAAPKAEERISYGIGAFYLDGKFLVGLGAAAAHCAFYPGSTLQAFEFDLAKYDTGKGTIRFQPAKPLPAALVRRIIKARMAQQEAKRKVS